MTSAIIPPGAGAFSQSRDPREERTVQRLTEAVLSLAGEQDITRTSVAELTRKAGINRSTFYAFATSPVELLANVLNAELDVARRSTAGEISESGRLTRDIMRHTLDKIVDHVEQHSNIYARPYGSSSRFAVRVVLAEHVEQSVLQVLRDGFIDPPINDPAFGTMFASFLAHGIAGVVETWMQSPTPRVRATLIGAIEQMYPPWFAPNISGSGWLRNRESRSGDDHEAPAPERPG